ncbi:hypothetical protein BASA62_009590 [Batrachochytrium salamandrivorans]|nr:hypothetical protein BASA62_009590 [Batrachochytrium salamandrivorans]
MANWNKHHGVGATLIENWVEEQAVGDLIISERSDVRNLSRDGHKDIIFQSNAKPIVPMISTSKEAYSAIPLFGSSKPSLGKRRQFMEAEMLKIAISDQQEQPLDQSFQIRTNLISLISQLHSGATMLQKEVEQPFAPYQHKLFTPKGFPGSGKRFDNKVAVDENQSSVLGHRAGQIHEMDASNVPIRFGKHPMFSTPIHESKYDEA